MPKKSSTKSRVKVRTKKSVKKRERVYAPWQHRREKPLMYRSRKTNVLKLDEMIKHIYIMGASKADAFRVFERNLRAKKTAHKEILRVYKLLKKKGIKQGTDFKERIKLWKGSGKEAKKRVGNPYDNFFMGTFLYNKSNRKFLNKHGLEKYDRVMVQRRDHYWISTQYDYTGI
jgi:hypothetical protein